MKGMNHTTGRALDGVPHVCQSVSKILTTPIGSRVGRREFGSELYELVDAPMNPATRVRLFAATATALMRWEPRLKLTRVGLLVDPSRPGRAVIQIEGITKISRETVSTEVPLTTTRAA